MDFKQTAFGEKVATWENNTHPDNPNYMQLVTWKMWVKKDGRFTIGYCIDPSSGKYTFVYPQSIDVALELYGPKKNL